MARLLLSILSALIFLSCSGIEPPVMVGAERLDVLVPKLTGQRVGLVVNQTSLVGSTHLVDTLLTRDINIAGIYAPEHGYRGNIERGQEIADASDSETGIPIFSIYGATRKPTPEMLAGIDLMVFDIQDVGVRFFTYISTLHYVMEACAEQDIPVLVLDRPNPLGHYFDGPIMQPEYSSFIGLHTVPVVHGMTIGEYARMINGEGWLANGIKCDLEVLPLLNYTHQSRYTLPVPPSPNLPDMKSIYLYPSTCFFEGTAVSEGRGTLKPFQQFGAPWYTIGEHQFTPVPIPAMAADPQFNGQVCYGYDLSGIAESDLARLDRLQLRYLLSFYQYSAGPDTFFTPFFERLAGDTVLRQQLIDGRSEKEIRASWQPGLERYGQTRAKYLLYPE